MQRSHSLAYPFFTFLLSFISVLMSCQSNASESHEIVLGPNDRYEVRETAQWRFEVLKESAGRFTDVQFKPKHGDAFNLTLYFLADTPDHVSLDTPEKIAAAVQDGAEQFLPLTVEKKITLQAIAPRGSFGSLTVMTAAAPKGAPGEFKYQTRGLVRLSSQASLGFSLLSNEINTAGYRQWLNHTYSFIKLTPPSVAHSSANSAASSVSLAPPATAPVAPTTPQNDPPSAVKTTPPQPAPVARPPAPAPRATGRDKRDCLSLPTNAEIIRCVGASK